MTTTMVRRNVLAGLVLMALGLLFGAFMGAAHDIAAIQKWLRFPPIRSNQVMYAHAHLGVIGLTNIVLGIILPATTLRARTSCWVSWSAVAAGYLVPAGMMLSLLPHPWSSLIYLQAAGFVLLLFAVTATAWGLRRAAPPAEPRP